MFHVGARWPEVAVVLLEYPIVIGGAFDFGGFWPADYNSYFFALEGGYCLIDSYVSPLPSGKSIADLPKLQSWQAVFRFDSTVSPPRDTGTI